MGDIPSIQRPAARPTTQAQGTAPTTKTTPGLTAGQIANNQEKAFDAAFNGNAPVTATETVGFAQVDIGAQTEEALVVLRGLRDAYMKDPPSGAVADAFFAEVDGFDGAALQSVFSPTSEEARDPTLSAPLPSQDPAMDKALDRYWSKVLDHLPNPANTEGNPAAVFLSSPAGAPSQEAFTKVITSVLESIAAQEEVEEEQSADTESGAMARTDGQEATSPSPGTDDKTGEAIGQAFQSFLDSSGINFATGDIETLVQIVMMNCAHDTAIDFRDQLKTMQTNITEKKKVRELLTLQKKDQEALKAQLYDEWNQNMTAQTIDPSVKFEDYCAERKLTQGYVANDGKFVPGKLADPAFPFFGPWPKTIAYGWAPNSEIAVGITNGTSAASAAQKEVDAAQAAVDKANAAVVDASNALAPATAAVDAAVKNAADCEVAWAYSLEHHIPAEQREAALVAFQQMREGQQKEIAALQATAQPFQDKLNNAVSDLDGANARLDKAQKDKSAADTTLADPKYVKGPFATAEQQAAAGDGTFGTLSMYDTTIQGTQDKLDSLGDQSQEDQMRMQQLLERYNKCFETMSNIFKKLSQTAETIVSNMK